MLIPFIAVQCVEYTIAWSPVFSGITYWKATISMMKIVKALDVWKKEGAGLTPVEEEEFFKIEHVKTIMMVEVK